MPIHHSQGQTWCHFSIAARYGRPDCHYEFIPMAIRGAISTWSVCQNLKTFLLMLLFCNEENILLGLVKQEVGFDVIKLSCLSIETSKQHLGCNLCSCMQTGCSQMKEGTIHHCKEHYCSPLEHSIVHLLHVWLALAMQWTQFAAASGHITARNDTARPQTGYLTFSSVPIGLHSYDP